jgi:hypothetical protein
MRRKGGRVERGSLYSKKVIQARRLLLLQCALAEAVEFPDFGGNGCAGFGNTKPRIVQEITRL